MTKLLTESEAWEFISNATIINRVSDGGKCYRLEFPITQENDAAGLVFTYGLCGAVRKLWEHDYILSDTYETMKARLKERRRQCLDEVEYIWPLTLLGQQERLAFARRMAEQTKGQ